ncbi:MAG: di-trans,poly-cis-decaprenylcistransferase [Desulfovibrio sp.]|nr:di-trans,poly-cis-decaprenylcistransferase [Desulfovibrio sp.]
MKRKRRLDRYAVKRYVARYINGGEALVNDSGIPEGAGGAALSADPPGKLPGHVAIIMDGNGRWAEARNLPRSEGHRAGTAAARAAVEECLGIGIAELTLYTFSRENWSRPVREVRFLFKLLTDFINKELPVLEKRGVRLLLIGETAELPLYARRALDRACLRTRNNERMVLTLALNYSGREDIARACRMYMQSGAPVSALDPDMLARSLYTAGRPDPDLVIRTGGEKRLSNFLLFQAAYSELYFCDILWPDFSPADLHDALRDYAGRTRRYGGTGGQSGCGDPQPPAPPG